MDGHAAETSPKKSGEGISMTLEELTDDEVIDLAVEQLALLVLARVAGSSDLLFGNFIGSGDLLERSYAAKSALAEAWNWLERKGLLGPNIGQNTGWQTITRAGRQVIEEGQPALARLRAAERLDVELHPSLELLVRPQFLIGSYEMAVFEAFKPLRSDYGNSQTAPQRGLESRWRRTPSASRVHCETLIRPFPRGRRMG
jgi:hypothetical protein